MSISLQDALGVQPSQPPTARAPKSPNGSFSLQDGLGVAGGKPPTIGGQQPDKPGLWDHFQTALAKIGTDYGKNVLDKEYSAANTISSGFKDMFGPEDETKLPGVQGVVGVGKALLGTMDSIFAPFSAAVEEAASKPSAAVVNKIGSMVPTSERGGNFDISKQDVKRNTAALNEFLDTAFQTYVGLKSFPESHSQGALDLLTPEARAEFKARPAREAKKVETAFDMLAVKDPEGAADFANSVNKIDLKLSKSLHKKVQKWIDASDEELNKLGAEHAKQQLESMDGKMPTDYTKLGLEGWQGGTTGEKFTTEKLKPFQPQPAEPPVQRDALGTPLNVEATTKVEFIRKAERSTEEILKSLDSFWESVQQEHEADLKGHEPPNPSHGMGSAKDAYGESDDFTREDLYTEDEPKANNNDLLLNNVRVTDDDGIGGVIQHYKDKRSGNTVLVLAHDNGNPLHLPNSIDTHEKLIAYLNKADGGNWKVDKPKTNPDPWWKNKTDAEMDKLFPTSGQNKEVAGTFTPADLFPADSPKSGKLPYGYTLHDGSEVTQHAGGVIFKTPKGNILVGKRAPGTDVAGKWGIFGGKFHPGRETIEAGVLREVEEETGYKHTGPLKKLTRTVTNGVDYTTFMAEVPDKFEPKLNWEHEKASWLPPGDISRNSLHPGLAHTIEHPTTKAALKVGPKVVTPSVGASYKGAVKDSAGKLVHPTAEGQAAFKDWFKDSVTVDAQGQPIVFYHGTKHNIKSFSNEKSAQASGRPFISLSTDPKFASEWKSGHGTNVVPVYARATNVADFRNPEHVKLMAEWLNKNDSEYGKLGIEYLTKQLEAARWGPWEKPKAWKELGFDGAWVREYDSGPLNFVTQKDKGNIKSAYGNRGTFSGKNPLLVYSGVDVPRLFNFARQSKFGAILEGKLKEYYDYMIRNINPEALGAEAKKAAAVLARGVADLARDDSMYVHRSMDRKLWWEKNQKIVDQFINRFERGDKFKDSPALAKVAEGYRQWNDKILMRDRSLGIDYEPQDHYLPHIYENPKGVQEFYFQKFGPSWTTPGFAKTRAYELYEAAEKAGFKRKYTNPEDIMLARQHASDVAEMKVQTLQDLEKQGLAVKKTKGSVPPGPNYTSQPSPNGSSYWVHNDAYQVLHNAFNTTSLWTLQGPVGDAFRGMMAVKNALIPIKLGLSLFHPLHVATIHNATSMVRASKELLAGTKSVASWMADMAKATVYKGFLDDPKSGSRILRAFQGKIPDTALTAVDKVAIKMMAEGGFIPEMSSQYRMKAIDNFRMAVARGSPTAAWHAPWAALQLMQKPIFEVWIPSLKIASYLADVKTALKTNPRLIENESERLLALRKLAKSVDNRYGEMAYNTLFWNRWVKDIATANTLSLGWQLGFLREYGGGLLDVGQTVRADGSLAAKAASGMLDRPLFVTFYTAQAMAYGGLMTWAMTGKPPTKLLDYIYPQTGEHNKDGSDARVGTMFYTKEFAATAKHIETEGVVGGLSGLAASKASGLIGLTKEAFTGVNSWGDQIRQQGDPLVNQIGQTITNMAPELNTISLEAIRGLPGKTMLEKVQNNPAKAAMSVAGFTKAPKYITQSKTDAAIDQLYKREYAPKETSFDKAEYSKEARELRKMYDESDERFDDKLSEIEDKYKLTPLEARKLRQKVQKESDPQITKFKGFTWQEQKRLLDQMTPDEREKFLKHSNKQHLRYKYEPPADESQSDSSQSRGAA